MGSQWTEESKCSVLGTTVDLKDMQLYHMQSELKIILRNYDIAVVVQENIQCLPFFEFVCA